MPTLDSLKLNLARKLLEKHKLHYWDIRAEEASSTGINAWNNELRRIAQSLTGGFSVRVLYGNGWGFAASTDFKKIAETIQKAVKVAKVMARATKIKTGVAAGKPARIKKVPKLKKDPRDVSLAEKRNLILGLAKKAYRSDSRIKSAIVGYTETVENKLFFSYESLVEQKLTYVHVGARIMASSKGKNEEQHYSKGGLAGYSVVEDIEEKISETCKKTLLFLNAEKAEGGNFTVLANGEMTDVFIHEALGHASEADNVLSGGSCLAGMIGKKIAPRYISVIDDSTSGNRMDFGSYYFDDEGTPAQKTYIIKNGILKTFLHNRETAYKLKAKPTGNARAQSFAHRPIVRMSNTYAEKGKDSIKNMLSKIKKGYLLKGAVGGQVDPAKGSFLFSASEAYLVKKGQIEKPLRAVSISGNIFELLQRIVSVGNRYEEPWPGFCGKGNQRVPVNGRNPSVLIKGALIS